MVGISDLNGFDRFARSSHAATPQLPFTATAAGMLLDCSSSLAACFLALAALECGKL
jgi:hypothetical protein